jgi:hypothetical protein
MSDNKPPPKTTRGFAMDGYMAAPRKISSKVTPPTGGSSVKPPRKK